MITSKPLTELLSKFLFQKGDTLLVCIFIFLQLQFDWGCAPLKDFYLTVRRDDILVASLHVFYDRFMIIKVFFFFWKVCWGSKWRSCYRTTRLAKWAPNILCQTTYAWSDPRKKLLLHPSARYPRQNLTLKMTDLLHLIYNLQIN